MRMRLVLHNGEDDSELRRLYADFYQARQRLVLYLDSMALKVKIASEEIFVEAPAGTDEGSR